MEHLFFGALAVGSLCLLLQIVLSLIGGDSDLDEVGELDDALDLFSVRALSAGLATFGVSGLVLSGWGLPAAVAAIAALLPAAGAAAATAWATGAMLQLQSDGSLRLEGAVGAAGTTYLTIPPAGGGTGKVTLVLQGRSVELYAVTPETNPIPTGRSVVIVGVLDDSTVEVVPTPTMGELLDVNS